MKTDSPVAPPAGPAFSKTKLLAFAALSTVAGLVLLEGLASLAWLALDLRAWARSRPRVQTRSLEEFHSEYDPDLGWRHTPGKRLESFYGPGKSITINADGLRGLEPVVEEGAPRRYRVVCLGDSFTMGYGVDDRDTYPFRLQARNPRVQALNMGQGGYSIGQDYLWYRRLSERLDADALVFTFIGYDMLRMGDVRTDNGYALPRFSLSEGKVVVSNQPVPPRIDVGRRMIEAGEVVRFVTEHNALARTLERLTRWVRPARHKQKPDDADLGVLMLTMFQELDLDCRAHRRAFALVLLPTTVELPGQPGYTADDERFHQRVSASVQAFAAERGIPFLDLLPAFAAHPEVGTLFLDETYHHYSPRGNEVVADALDRWLRRNLSGYPGEPEEAPSRELEKSR